ncbi:hypothetical protein EJ357_33475 [Streptomyces cyaneochromogenes]|uniref:Uncharacterized protein n=1 Tax=Streptomyces cyaneochromogenes TaxID=2496836 RepID=A0A3Q9EXM3_9ACTN|nr:hypothetical protein [Streptomyces cyaneochromogenes]AZQ37767.1 hypothetical protein EJ357_33475 [Streptomyces cyaneochromogenes]
MPSPPSDRSPDEPGAGSPRTPGPPDRTLGPPAEPPHRLALDLDDCRQERDRWQRHADSYERELTRALLERAHLLAWLAVLHPSSAVLTPVTDSDGPGGSHLLRLEAGGQQLSWRLAPADLPLFTHVPCTEPATAPPRGDGQAPLDQAAHLRRHIHLLAMEGILFTAPAEKRPAPVRPVRPVRPGDH